LVGDALQARAFEVLATEIFPAERAARCCAELAQAAGATALVGGQADDLASQFFEPADDDQAIEQLELIHRRKTGALFRVSLRLGAIDDYGRHLGLAFQVVDDLLDVSGNETAVGKRLGKDSACGKTTYPAVLGIEASHQRVQTLIDAASESIETFGDAATPLRELAQFVGRRNN
jgi:geranylgeranyl pyrophosphate synthase